MSFSIRQSVAWMAVAQGGQFLMSFGMSLVIARLLSPYEMGIFALAIAVVGVLSTLRSLGLPSYIVRATEIDSELTATAFTINAILAVLIAATIACLGTLGQAILNEPGVERLLLALSIVPILSIFEFLPAAMLERDGSFRAIASVNVTRMFVSNLVVICFATYGYSYMSLAYGQIAGAATAVFCVNLVGWRYVNVRLSIENYRAVIKYGLQMLTISGVSMLFGRLAELLFGRILGLAALGLYSRASGLNGLIWDNLYTVITRVVFVDFADQSRRGHSLRHSYLRTVRMVTALLWPAFLGLSIIAGPVVLAFYGERWIGAAAPLSLLALSSVVLVSITMSWEVFVVCHETGRQARFEFIRSGVGLALFLFGCVFGLMGVAAGKIIEALFAVALYRPHLERMTETRWQDFVPVYLESSALAVFAVCPALVLLIAHDWSPNIPFSQVVFAVIAGAFSWLLCIRKIKHPIYLEIERFAGFLKLRGVRVS